MAVAVLAAGIVGVVDAQSRSIARPWKGLPFRAAVVKISASATDTIATGQDRVPLGLNQILAARVRDSSVFERAAGPADAAPGPGPAPEVGAAVFEMPFRYAGWAGGSVRGYRPVYVAQGPLRYNAAVGAFQGGLLVRIEDTVDLGARGRLDPPVELTVGSDADSVNPARLLFDAAGTYQQLTVTVRAPRDRIRVQMVPPFDRDGATTWLPVQPTLVFERPTKSIQGFGVEVARLRVGVRGTVLAAPLTASVAADRGSPGADELEIGAAGGTVTLRSGGQLGPATVSVNAPGLDEATATVEFVWPLFFAVAAILGALLGAVGAQMRRRKVGKTSTWFRNVLGATIGALIATAAYVGLGVNLIASVVSAPLTNELAVFAFAALGSMLGLNLAAGRDGGGRVAEGPIG